MVEAFFISCVSFFRYGNKLMTMSRYHLLAVLGVIVFLAQACLSNSDDNNDDPGEPFITGIITEIEPSSERLLIEENPDVNGPLDSGGNKIWLTVDNKTKLLRDENGSLRNCDFSCFEINDLASAWVSGAVAESYPLQGTASRIVIIGKNAEN